MDGQGATHVSEYRGTQTHMAPEAQLSARVSKAGDGECTFCVSLIMWGVCVCVFDCVVPCCWFVAAAPDSYTTHNHTHTTQTHYTQHTHTMTHSVYAFGITLWELFTGGHVFSGEGGASTAHCAVYLADRV